jgi:hypothetical protein
VRVRAKGGAGAFACQPREEMAPAFQFLVEIIQQKVSQQRGERTTLWGTLIAGYAHPILNHASLEKAPDDAQEAFVADPARNSGQGYVLPRLFYAI